MDGTNHSLPCCYQHNGMDSNEYNINSKQSFSVQTVCTLDPKSVAQLLRCVKNYSEIIKAGPTVNKLPLKF
jgi:hypothetical protein